MTGTAVPATGRTWSRGSEASVAGGWPFCAEAARSTLDELADLTIEADRVPKF